MQPGRNIVPPHGDPGSSLTRESKFGSTGGVAPSWKIPTMGRSVICSSSRGSGTPSSLGSGSDRKPVNKSRVGFRGGCAIVRSCARLCVRQ